MASKITFNFGSLKWENLTVDQVKIWEAAFPDVDVIDILTKKMPIWLTNPDNAQKAHKKRWQRFIENWLSRSQERYDLFKEGYKR